MPGIPGALVLNGNTTDLDLLEMEGVEGIESFVALTNRDEVNMLAALLAKACGARRAIPLIHKLEYMTLVDRVGLDAGISPRIASIATLKGNRSEAIESVIGPRAQVVGRQLRSLRFPRWAFLGEIVRGEEVIMARGGNRLEPWDHAIIFAGLLALAVLGHDLETAIGASVAAIANIGPGLGAVGPVDNYGWMDPLSHLVLIGLMIVGRLEIFTDLLLLHPDLWRR